MIENKIILKAVCDKLNCTPEELTKEKLKKIKKLDISNNQLTDLKGIEYLTKLKKLDISHNQLTNIKGIEKLNKLKYLYISHNPLTNTQKESLEKALPNCNINLLLIN